MPRFQFSPFPKMMNRLVIGVGLSLVACVSSGCVALAVGGAAAGGAAVAYAKGDEERTYPYPIDVVHEGTLAALAELQLPLGYQARDQLRGRIDAHTATGDTIKVRLTGLGQATKLKLRVNTFGNKSMQMAILGKIDEHLPRFATSDEAPLSLPVPAQDGQTSERGDPHDRVFSLDDTPPSPHDTLPSPAP